MVLFGLVYSSLLVFSSFLMRMMMMMTITALRSACFMWDSFCVCFFFILFMPFWFWWEEGKRRNFHFFSLSFLLLICIYMYIELMRIHLEYCITLLNLCQQIGFDQKSSATFYFSSFGCYFTRVVFLTSPHCFLLF